MNWQYVMIFVAVALVAGGMAWVRPSPRQKYLAQLRMKAIQAGVKVAQLRVPDLTVSGRVNEEVSAVTVYRHFLPQGQKLEVAKSTLILRTTGDSGIYLPDGWAWVDDKQLPKVEAERFTEFLSALPEDVSGVELHQQSYGLIWNEKADLPFIQGHLLKLGELLNQNT